VPGSEGPPAHRPVLLEEALALLEVKAGGFYVDGTVGLGGHAIEILRRSAPSGRLLGVDRDAEALAEAGPRLSEFGQRVRLVHATYQELPALLASTPPDGVLLDLGVSSRQLDDPQRGFSFRREGPLDMRMDRASGETAASVVNRMPEPELADLIYRYGEERASRRIARAIVEARRRAPVRTTSDLAEVVRRAMGSPRRRGPARGARRRAPIDPATRTFQALRIHVNRELEGLAETLSALAGVLAAGGRLAVISFHSLEDREVKQTFRALDRQAFRLLTKKPVRPGEGELAANPRARSARLRAVAREVA
jgi:16S rRNA (cytosine1402-N4)-methyltransferase